MSESGEAHGQQILLEPVARKAAERFDLLMHVIVSISLIQEAIPAIRTNPRSDWFAWVEVIAASALIVAAIRELKLRKAEAHESVAWTEIFAGGVLLVEAGLKWREGPRHYPLAVARAFAASLVILIGVSHARLQAARSLKIDDQGIRWRRRMSGKGIDWIDLTGVSIDDRAASFESRNGSGPTLSLARLANRKQIADAIAAAVASRGLSVSDTRIKR